MAKSFFDKVTKGVSQAAKKAKGPTLSGAPAPKPSPIIRKASKGVSKVATSAAPSASSTSQSLGSSVSQGRSRPKRRTPPTPQQKARRQIQRRVLSGKSPTKPQIRLLDKTPKLERKVADARLTQLRKPIKAELGIKQVPETKVPKVVIKQVARGKGEAKLVKAVAKQLPKKPPPKAVRRAVKRAEGTKAKPRTNPKGREKRRPAKPTGRERRITKRLTKAAKRSGGLIEKLDRPFEPDGGETLTTKQVAILHEAFGLPGVTYAKGIVPHESGNQPGATNPDDGTPSLDQITPSVQSEETQAIFDKIASQHKGGYSNPVASVKMAKVLAGDGDGTSNYVAYDGSPIQHLPGGQKAAQKKLYGGADIPEGLKEKAEKVLGEKQTKKVIAKGKSAGVPEAPKKSPGAWAGSKSKVREKLKGLVDPSEFKDDKRTPEENAAVGGATGSRHLTTMKKAFAADIPPDPKVYQELRGRLGLPKGPTTGNDEVVIDGYAYRLIFGEEFDHGDHIHLDAEWMGDELPAGTSLGGPVSSVSSTGTSSGGGAITTTGTPTGTAGTAATASRKKRRKRKPKTPIQVPALSEVELPNVDFSPSETPYGDYLKTKAAKVSL